MPDHNNFTPLKQFRGVFRALKLVFLSISMLMVLSHCEEKKETPPWDKVVGVSDVTAVEATKTTASATNKPATTVHQGSVRFVFYNIRNYLQMRRGNTLKPKPENEISDLIVNIVRTNPDVLGVCEIGGQKDIADLQSRLKKAGCDLPYSYLAPSADPVRRLAMLSKLPLTPHAVPQYSYRLDGHVMEIRRGILDVSIHTSIGEVRFLGAHLKSKRPIKGADQALIRRNEASLLRKHASSLLKDSQIKLLVFGDMNDTKRSAPIRTIRGPSQGRQSLKAIELYAKNGTKWTQYWAAEDIYSRFDFAFTSESLRRHIDRKKSYILDVPRGDKASDHRALIVVIEGK